MTKEQPKEMMPLFAQNNNNGLHVKPLFQIIFEQLYDNAFREFCFIIGRGKRVIEDHFTIDLDFIKQLNNKGKHNLSSPLEQFYKKLEASFIMWINQPEPKGFGYAVLMAKLSVKNETKRSEMGQRATQKCFKEYSLKAVAQKWIESLKVVVGKRV